MPDCWRDGNAGRWDVREIERSAMERKSGHCATDETVEVSPYASMCRPSQVTPALEPILSSRGQERKARDRNARSSNPAFTGPPSWISLLARDLRAGEDIALNKLMHISTSLVG